MNLRLKLMAIPALVLFLGGCGTIVNFVPPFKGSRDEFGLMRIYGGVRIDVATLSEAEWLWQKLLTILILIVELPLSFTMDTVTLPITIPVTLSR
jgi:uncharacterized protein YceK